MFVGNGFAGFQLNDEFAFYKEVGEEVTENGSVPVMHLNGVLLLDG